MKKILLAFVFVLAIPCAFAQIYRGEGEGKNGAIALSLHFVEYADYRYLLLVDGVSVFMEEDTLAHLAVVLEKFKAWEAIAAEGRVTLTKTIDSIAFSSFHYNHTFFREQAVFYFVFTGGPLQSGVQPDAGETPLRYTLYIDTTLDRITPFRLASETAEALLEALSPENLAEALEVYERQKALEELFR